MKQKITAMLLFAGMLTQMVLSAGAAPSGKYDANGDGTVNMADAAELEKKIEAGETVDEVYDFMGDGAVDGSDVEHFLWSFVKPEEYPVETINEKRNEELADMAERNGGELPIIYLEKEDDIPAFISGTYSDTVVTDSGSAIASLSDIQSLMLIDSPEDSFAEMDVSERNGSTFYKLQQMYKGLPVYGKQVIVVADEDGNIKSMSGDYDPLFDIDTTPAVSAEDARGTAAEACGYENTAEAELVIYSIDNCDALAWLFSDSACDVIVDAVTGEVIQQYDNVYTSQTTGQITGEQGTFEFPVVYEDGAYYMRDTTRNIWLKDAHEQSVFENAYDFIDGDNQWEGEDEYDAVRLYAQLCIAYDYYLDTLGLVSCDGLGSPMYGIINMIPHGIACGGGIYDQYGLVGFDNGYEHYIVLDVVAHEYTHAVEQCRSQMKYSGESGAIMEANSDVMGELIEEAVTGTANWEMADMRSLSNPSSWSEKLEVPNKPSLYYIDG